VSGTFTLCCYLPVVLGMLGSMSDSAAICFPRAYTSFQTDGSPLSALMMFITTLAFWAASMRSTLFPYNIVDIATVMERTSSAAYRGIV